MRHTHRSALRHRQRSANPGSLLSTTVWMAIRPFSEWSVIKQLALNTWLYCLRLILSSNTADDHRERYSVFAVARRWFKPSTNTVCTRQQALVCAAGVVWLRGGRRMHVGSRGHTYLVRKRVTGVGNGNNNKSAFPTTKYSED